MPKKKGNLKAALHGHLANQELKTREKAAQEAAKRKAMSVAKSRGLKGAPTQQSQSNKRKTTEKEHDSATILAENELQQTNRRSKRLVQPFSKEDSILIVGEANFSFALSLMLPPRNHPPSQLLATAYDSEEECYQKYPDARANVERLRKLAGRDDVVLFNVDAGQLEKHKQITGVTKSRTKAAKQNLEDMTGWSSSDRNEELNAKKRWSKVWFGFPHVGAGHKDETRNVLANQLLILRFLISIAPFLTAGPPPQYVPGGSGPKRQRNMSDDEEEGEEVVEGQDDDIELTEPEHLADMTEADQAILNITNSQVAASQPLRPPNKRGSILITLRNASPYTLWDVANLAKRLPQMLPSVAASAPALPKGLRKPTLHELNANGLSLKSPQNLHTRTVTANKGGAKDNVKSKPRRSGFYKSYHLWRSFEFDPSEWLGYQHRRTIGYIEGVSTLNNEDLLRSRTTAAASDPQARASKAGGGECRTWEFGLE